MFPADASDRRQACTHAHTNTHTYLLLGVNLHHRGLVEVVGWHSGGRHRDGDGDGVRVQVAR